MGQNAFSLGLTNHQGKAAQANIQRHSKFTSNKSMVQVDGC